ncbi:MAG: dihydropteroate synthase [Planctomycetales bacterium]|nr:dihydropteroate synthase [Planctomycetales bacterium]MBN8627328.1 dihydropteroate synthase [Planctomycetota bacterium]
MTREHIQFVTGRLAEFSLRKTLEPLAKQVGFDYTVDVLHITVAALMSPQWIAKRVARVPEATRVLVPGYCAGDLQSIVKACGKPVERGPKDLRDLPAFFGRKPPAAEDYGKYDIEIIAEINHAPRLSRGTMLAQARAIRADGADLIDIGCEPGQAWSDVGDIVRMLRDEGLRVSIDSMNPVEIAAAAKNGAELVLSVNSHNRAAAADWGIEVVVVPDDPSTLTGLDDTIEYVAGKGIPLRIDPILEPIGFGFAQSLGRYLDIRRRYPDAEMMMGIGNLTELTDADSAAMNVLLLGFCQELGIRSVLTTQVINWARTCVKECAAARQLVHYAVATRNLPKRVDNRLVMLRDPRRFEHGPEALAQLTEQIRDDNVRIFAERGELHVVSAGLHLQGVDPFDLFEDLLARRPAGLDAGHAFYLGFEMAKALTALTLDKDYRQDQALDWGLLTRPEESHRERKRRRAEAAAKPEADRATEEEPS